MRKVPLYLVVLIMALLSIVPFYVLLCIAFNPPTMMFSNGLALPHFYLDNITTAWKQSHLGRAMINSAIITAGALILTVTFTASAGYAIARFPNKLHKITFNSFLFSMMIPGIINTVPLYIIMRRIGGINTHWAMILLATAGSIPFATFLYTNFIKSTSREIEESAIIDGCSWFSAFWRVTFPLLKPITATVIIMNAVGFWNDYSRAVFFLQKQEMHTVPLAISVFVQTYGAKWNLMAADALIGLIPAVAVFLIFQKNFVKGLTSGAVKG